MDAASQTFIAKRCWVAGRVQGVFYRKSAQVEAEKLGIKGYAKNLPDGRVEVLMIGVPSQLAILEQWLWRGSPTSRVTEVKVTAVNLAEVGSLPSSFSTA